MLQFQKVATQSDQRQKMFESMLGDYFRSKLSLSNKESKGDKPDTIKRENLSASFISLDNEI